MVVPSCGAPPQCTYLLPHKNRLCRLPRKSNTLFCGAHATHSSAVPCPHCHTQLPSPAALARHIRASSPACPVLRRRAAVSSQPWFHRDCNRPPISPYPEKSAGNGEGWDTARLEALVDRLLARLPVDDLMLEKPHASVLPEGPRVAARWANERDSSTKLERKHFAQIEALCALLLMPPPSSRTAILEVGAGRSYTALYAAEVEQLRGNACAVVAVDRASTRYKADRVFHAWEKEGRGSFRRLRCDVKDLWLEGVEELRGCGELRVVGKHVCGGGLDMALGMLIEFVKRWRGGVRMVFASCCRRLCEWGDDVWEGWGVDEEAFREVCRGASWGLGAEHDDWRKVIGEKCRRVVDLARVVRLRRHGWKAWLGTYTAASPENACIVADWEREEGVAIVNKRHVSDY